MGCVCSAYETNEKVNFLIFLFNFCIILTLFINIVINTNVNRYRVMAVGSYRRNLEDNIKIYYTTGCDVEFIRLSFTASPFL
jgi:hypothetical protein